MTTATLNCLKMQKKIQAKMDSVELPSVNWKAICLIGFFISLFLLVFYVWQINDLIKGSYLTSNYEKQINNLSSENKNLEISFAESSFLGQAVGKIQALDFQKNTSVKYIQVPDSSVAVNIK